MTNDITILRPSDSAWLSGFTDSTDRLHVRGNPSVLADVEERGIAIVGSRASTPYGTQLASDLAYGLVQQGFIIVSGAAHGIDAAAHRGALAAGGTTVALMACGVDVAYPAANTGLLDQIAATGTIVATLPNGTVPNKTRFIERNELLGSITCAVLVVEAGRRSGALGTARAAHDLGHPVGAVPGPVTSPASHGVHQLIREGIATLVTDVDDCVELFQ